MKRLERKYLVPNQKLDELRQRISPFLRNDVFLDDRPEPIKHYTVRSIYFDTADLNDYHEKIEGIRIRKKVRLRGYDNGSDDCLVYLEIKRKEENRVWKNRAPVRYRDVEQLFLSRDIQRFVYQNGRNGAELEDASRFFYQMLRRSLRPICLVVYEREAFHGRFNDDLRITFDKNLRSMMYPGLDDLFSPDLSRYAVPGAAILEVKYYEAMPNWLKSVMQEMKLRREALSKYALCLQSHGVDDFPKFAPLAFPKANWQKLPSRSRNPDAG